jgi:glycosyltransferase involved in cell wall biosynthesis
MRLMFVITGLGAGGAEAMLVKLLAQKAFARDEIMVVSLLGSGTRSAELIALGHRLEHLGISRSLSTWGRVFGLYLLIRTFKPDLIHSWMYHADLVAGIIGKIASIRHIVWSIRQSNLAREYNKTSTLLVIRACAFLSSFIPNAIITNSTVARQSHIVAGYKTDKIRVIPNGFDLVNYVPKKALRSAFRVSLNMDDETPLVGLVARFDSVKNHAGFFAAAQAIHAALPDVRFVLAGTDIINHNQTLMAMIDKAGLRGQTHLLGAHDDIASIMNGIDVLLSSSHGEAFPNVLGEAMACGTPCVTTDVGDCKTIVDEIGGVVKAGDMDALAKETIAILSLSAKKRSILARNARMRIESHYEIGKIASDFRACYIQVHESAKPD